jgi:putative DNA methylase
LLFTEARTEALKRFIQALIGTEVQVWKLANALSALYPKFSEEKRWVDGVLARKKGLEYLKE